MNYIQSILLAIVEGITEFLPISSTGHMIILASIMGILKNPITNLFIISVQFGSILSIVFLYRKKIFFQKLNFYLKILIATLPILIFGWIFHEKINFFMKNPLIVALSLLIGGLIILKSENFYNKNFCKKNKNYIDYYRSFIIGMFQCLSLIPGFSRSATIIIACLLQKIDREESIEFSFFLSIPIICLATLKKLYDYYFIKLNSILSFHHIKLLLLGNIVSFITSMIFINYLINFLKKNNFKLFGYYRIILGFILIFINYYFCPIENF